MLKTMFPTWMFSVLLLCGCPPENNSNNAPDVGVDMPGEADSGESEFAEPFDPAELGWGLHVIGRGPDDIYVAGGAPDGGELLHFDGESWVPEPIPDVPLLNWVQPFDDGQTVAVGNAGTIIWDSGDGAWVQRESPTEEDLWGVWGTSPDDVWAVGGRGREAGQATLLRYDGTDWTATEVPDLERPGVNAFFKVWGTSADNVYIVGQNGIVLRWNGTEIEEIGVGTSEDLISLWGTGPDDIILVGGRSNGVMSHWDGTDWTTESISPAPGVNGIWMPAPGEFWIAGVRGMLRRGTVTEDGFDVPRTTPLTESDLHAVYGIEGYGLITVGGNFTMTAGPFDGAAFVKTKDWQ